jgi:hypothetical protein
MVGDLIERYKRRVLVPYAAKMGVLYNAHCALLFGSQDMWAAEQTYYVYVYITPEDEELAEDCDELKTEFNREKLGLLKWHSYKPKIHTDIEEVNGELIYIRGP